MILLEEDLNYFIIKKDATKNYKRCIKELRKDIYREILYNIKK